MALPAIVTLVAFGLVSLFLVLVLRQQRPEFGPLLVVAAGAVLLLGIVDDVARLVVLLQGLGDRAHVNFQYVTVLLRVVAAAYVAEFAAQLARDAGESALAGQIELAGKVVILLMAAPIVTAVVELVLSFVA